MLFLRQQLAVDKVHAAQQETAESELVCSRNVLLKQSILSFDLLLCRMTLVSLKTVLCRMKLVSLKTVTKRNRKSQFSTNVRRDAKLIKRQYRNHRIHN